MQQNDTKAQFAEIAEIMALFFTSKGIHVMRNDSRNTNSIYLRLDYGLLSTIRISDHDQMYSWWLYNHTKYGIDGINRFNAILNYSGPKNRNSGFGFKREFYGTDSDSLNELCKSVITLRNELLSQKGYYKYSKAMYYHKHAWINTKGYWKKPLVYG